MISDYHDSLVSGIASSFTVAEIARSPYLSEGSLRNRISDAISKVGARNRADVVRIASEHGWL
jgi:two-component system response regulator DesR